MAQHMRPAPRVAVLVLGVSSLVLAGCSRVSPSALEPAGESARRVAGLWWLLFAVATVVVLVVVGWVLWVVARRRGDDVRARPGGGRVVLVVGLLVPALILTGTYLLGLRDMRALTPPPGPADVTVEVIGHRWWWEVRYPGTDAVTANEIHVPVGKDVRVRLRSADVNHSFWVPQLAPKRDLIPGRTNDLWLKVDRAGRYRGQCAEYCGTQHGHMAFSVVAESPSQFAAWQQQQAAPAPQPVTALQTRGLSVLQNASCASCHTVRGTSARGKVGPDLTHLSTRDAIAAGAVPNNPGYLGGWIADSQTIKPGNIMPPQQLAPEDLQALIAYLDRSDAVSGREAP